MKLRTLPIFACVRDSAGIVLDVTDKLAAATGLSRDEIIGKAAVDVWPHQAESIALDARALELGKTIERLERSPRSGSFWRSVHTPDGDCVVWVGERADAEIRLAALRNLIRVAIDGERGELSLGGAEHDCAALLASGSDAWDISGALMLSPDVTVAALWRMAGPTKRP